MKKLLSVMLVIILLFSISVGCNNNKKGNVNDVASNTQTPDKDKSDTKQPSGGLEVTEDGVTQGGVFPIVLEPITISAFIAQTADVSDITNNKWVDYFEEKTNIYLDLEVVPSNSVKEKQKLLLASNNYPKIFLSGSFTNNDVINLGMKEKIFMPLKKYIDKYGVELKNLFNHQEYFERDITAPDGEVYVIPNSKGSDPTTYVARKAWVNVEWLKRLGLDRPNNIDEFKEMLLAFKNQDPNGNGKTDEVPFSGAINTWAAEPQWFIMNAFLPCEPNSNFCYIDSDEFYFAPVQEYWKKGLEYMAELYDLGLIDPASFTQNLQQLSQLGNNPDIELLGAYSAGHLAMGVDDTHTSTERTKMYEGLPIFEGIPGFREIPVRNGERVEGGKFAITDKCQHPAAALRLADYFFSEEAALYGERGLPENKSWRLATAGELNIYGTPAKYTTTPETRLDAGNARIYSWGNTSIFNNSKAIGALFSTSQDPFSPNGYLMRLKIEYDLYCQPYISTKADFPPIWLDGEDAEAYSQLLQPIKDYITATTAEFITGKRQISDWDKYIGELEALQYEKLIEIYERAIRERL